MQASDPNSRLLSISTSNCDIATIARESSATYQAIGLRSRRHCTVLYCTVLWSKAGDLNNHLSCAHRPHQTSASREPSSLHRSCGPPDRCALSTHGGGRWAMAMLSGSFECSPAAVAANVRASARSTAGCKARAHCIASYRSSRCTCTLCTVPVHDLPLPCTRTLHRVACRDRRATSTATSPAVWNVLPAKKSCFIAAPSSCAP